MSESIVSFVPQVLEYENPAEVASKLSRYLSTHKVIGTELKDHPNAPFKRFAPGANYREILSCGDEFNQVEGTNNNHIDIFSERTVFHGYNNGLDEVLCPKCQQNLIGTNWAETMDRWAKGGSGQFKCENCGNNAPISAYRFSSESQFRWAFSNVGISFYNWPPTFTEDFLTRIAGILESPVVIVHAHL